MLLRSPFVFVVEFYYIMTLNAPSNLLRRQHGFIYLLLYFKDRHCELLASWV